MSQSSEKQHYAVSFFEAGAPNTNDMQEQKKFFRLKTYHADNRVVSKFINGTHQMQPPLSSIPFY